MKLVMLINVEMPTNVGILTFISMINTSSECLKLGKNLYFLAFKLLKAGEISCSVEWSIIFFITSGPGIKELDSQRLGANMALSSVHSLIILYKIKMIKLKLHEEII